MKPRLIQKYELVYLEWFDTAGTEGWTRDAPQSKPSFIRVEGKIFLLILKRQSAASLCRLALIRRNAIFTKSPGISPRSLTSCA